MSKNSSSTKHILQDCILQEEICSNAPIMAVVKYAFKHIFLPLILGVSIYFFCSKSEIPLLGISDLLLQIPPLQHLKETTQHLNFPDFLIYQVPDTLWAYALCATLLLIWQHQKAALISSISFLISSIYEFGQYFDWFRGTFDWWDVLAMAIGNGLAFLVLNKKKS